MVVTVTYDTGIYTPSYIYRYTDGGITASSNLASLSIFDYFTDTAVVNDAIYFSSSYGYPFHDIRFYVGTAFVATSVTFAWEYWNGSAWIAIPGVVDNTNGFTVLGENWMTFTPPTDWVQKGSAPPLNASNVYIWIRCRIAAISGITEGGAQSTQQIKVKDWKINVSGGTLVAPATFTDIYNAGIAGGWGVCNRYGSDNKLFEINRYIVISDYFIDTNKVVLFADGFILQDWGIVIYANASAYVEFGLLYDTARKTTAQGIVFYFKENSRAYHWIDGNSTSTINLYSCSFKSDTFTRCNIGSVNRVWNCFGDRSGFRSIRSGVTDISNVITCACSESISNTPSSVDTFIAVETPLVGPPPNSEFFLKNSKCRTSGVEVTVWASNPSMRTRLVNPDIDWSEFNISWGGSPTGGEIWREYELWLKIIDNINAVISGALITLKDKDGISIFSQNTNPDGYINRDFGTATAGTITSITDTTKSWTINQWKGYDIYITSGTGSGQKATVVSNTATVLTISTIKTAPDITSKYILIPIITHSKYDKNSSTVPFATYNPFTLTIKRAGYETYKTKLTVDQKIIDSIMIKKSVPVCLLEGKPILKVSPDSEDGARLIFNNL